MEIPRDRNGEFKQQTLPAYKRTNDTLETTIIHLFEKGVTMSEIADLIEKNVRSSLYSTNHVQHD
ncbi:transposase, Mutator family [Enterococcus xinjiangensis]|nr:transposase, Mutator family [Enterococcus lactis]